MKAELTEIEVYQIRTKLPASLREKLELAFKVPGVGPKNIKKGDKPFQLRKKGANNWRHIDLKTALHVADMRTPQELEEAFNPPKSKFPRRDGVQRFKDSLVVDLEDGVYYLRKWAGES